jgi:hypothetical protein
VGNILDVAERVSPNADMSNTIQQNNDFAEFRGTLHMTLGHRGRHDPHPPFPLPPKLPDVLNVQSDLRSLRHCRAALQSSTKDIGPPHPLPCQNFLPDVLDVQRNLRFLWQCRATLQSPTKDQSRTVRMGESQETSPHTHTLWTTCSGAWSHQVH